MTWWPSRKRQKTSSVPEPLVPHSDTRERAAGAIASGPRSVAVDTGGAPFAAPVLTGDGARVIQVPAEAYHPMAEVEAPPGINNLESWPEWFVGRETELARLDAALTAGGQPVVVAAVHGLGGVGKSSLAAYWAGTRPHGCAPIVWISADTPAGVERGLAGFATRLQPALAEVLTVEHLAERALQWLATHTGWLLILDNVDNPADIAPVLARARAGRILITGRLSVPWQAGAEVISLDVLATDDAQQLLTGLTTAPGQGDLNGVAQLCEALGYLPLAIQQAGAYLAHQRFTTPRAYLQMLIDQPGLTFDRAAAGTNPQRTIARIWRVTLDRITDNEPAAVELLRTLAWYASDDIPLTLCRKVADLPTVDAALGVLAAYNMITPDPAGGRLSIHRLVQAVARTPDPADPHRDPAAIERARTRATETLHASLPDRKNPATWPTWRALLPHIDALTNHSTGNESTATSIAVIRNYSGLFMLDQGLHASALAHLRRALTDREQILGEKHADTLTSRNNLANAYQAAGKVAEAIPLYERTLTDREQILGEKHPDTLTSRNNLANAYQAAGRVAEAIALYERTLTDYEQVLGEEHPDTLASRNNLASAYQAAGRVAEAIPLYERTLTDYEQILGEKHPDTLTSRNNLADAYQAAGQFADAIPLHERTYTDREQVLGEEHPDTLTSRNNLASAYQAAGQTAEAIPLFERTLTDYEQVLGEKHPDTLASRNNLADAYRAAGRVAEAIPLLERTLTDREQVLGEKHPNTLGSRNNLASAYRAAGRVAEAIPLFERTLTDFAQILGPNHPNTGVVRDNLAAAQAAQWSSQ
ncbi:FxSxx-COOH system tetratricopeptide repeat protein [Nocardia fluminea]|uniref:FxSxx-COOH system tetratricopeptide repeat protein n=1 Tax=Nocardia fluminea TaxID=134984 RepID=UPI0036539732